MPGVDERFALMSDEEIIEKMITSVADEKLYRYFFYVRCAPFLRYISRRLYGSNDITILTGELFEFIANDDWAILRKWEKRNEASLFSYIARCATNHFVTKDIAERKRQDKETLATTPDIIEHLSSLADESETETLPIWKAYNMLNERDREVLRLLVIEENPVMSVAKELWRYVDCKQDICNLSPKRIQGTISMIKHRAQLALLENLEKLTRG